MCDGSHKPCREERPDVLLVYDAERKTVIEERPEP
jgi:hypothetical protein